MPVVLAHFAKRTTYVAIAFTVFAPIIPILIIHPVPWHQPSIFEAYWNAIGLLASFVMFCGGGVILYQVKFRRGAAVWLEDEHFVYLDTYLTWWLVRIPCSDIVSVSLGTIGSWKQEAIVIQLKNRPKRSFRTWFLSEPVDVLISRMTDAILGSTKLSGDHLCESPNATT